MIVSCGEALVDMVPGPVPGGGPMNVAVAAARLGVPSAFVGRISTDRDGELIWEHLRRNGVDLRAAERGPEPTARAIVEHVPQLRFTVEGDGTADMWLGEANVAALGKGPHVLHGGTLGLFRGHTAHTLARLVEAHHGIVSLDPNIRPKIIQDRKGWDHFHDCWLARAHIYRASDEDMEWIWPRRSHGSVAEQLLAGRASIVIITRGASGAIAYITSDQLTIAGHQVDVVDTVGAGDTFVGALLAALWDRGLTRNPQLLADITPSDLGHITRHAVAAAAITCSRLGADPPHRDELMNFLGR